MDNYNKQLIIWVVTFNAESSIWRSYYLRLTLYGFPETPFSNHLKNYNAKSIKPNHYSYGKFNNYKLRYANKKGKGQSDLVLSTLPFYKQNVRTLYITKCIQSLAN